MFRLFSANVASVLGDYFLWTLFTLFWRSVPSPYSKRFDYQQASCKCRQGPLVSHLVLDLETVKTLETSAKQHKFKWHHRQKTGSTTDQKLYAASSLIRNCVFETEHQALSNSVADQLMLTSRRTWSFVFSIPGLKYETSRLQSRARNVENRGFGLQRGFHYRK
jgi:hypothetical protein